MEDGDKRDRVASGQIAKALVSLNMEKELRVSDGIEKELADAVFEALQDTNNPLGLLLKKLQKPLP